MFNEKKKIINHLWWNGIDETESERFKAVYSFGVWESVWDIQTESER